MKVRGELDSRVQNARKSCSDARDADRFLLIINAHADMKGRKYQI